MLRGAARPGAEQAAGMMRSPEPWGMTWLCSLRSSSGYGLAPTEAVMPPPTKIACPVMWLPASEADSSNVPSNTCGAPMRAIGVWCGAR